MSGEAEIEKLAEVNRKQIEHRAAWMALIYDELLKAGIDGEDFIRRAVRRCGAMHGENFKKRCAGSAKTGDFAKVFLTDLGKATFGMVPETGGDFLKIDFHYCALVSAWKKLGFDNKTCALLCDIAMEGDRAVAETMGFNFELGHTIAQGCPECELRFSES